MSALTKKQRKWDRNRKRSGHNNRYIAEHRHDKSHMERIRAHLQRYGLADLVAVAAHTRYKIRAMGYA